VKLFRFRAQAAIDLRQREYDEARRVLARASLDLRAAQDVFGEASDRLTGAQEQGGREMRERIDAARAQWYRFWIVRLEHERAVCARAVAAREREVALATAACLSSKQRLESLERVRDKARQAWEHAVAIEEQKQIDALATLRHVAAHRESAQRSGT
jgi:flagellar biosynthesis chaperone FliJ